MNFRSDNVTGVAPEILAALARANVGSAAPYGEDEITARLVRRLGEVFEHEVAVFPVATGTAANVLGLAALTPPWGIIYCDALSHIAVDECCGPEFYTGGAKVVTIESRDSKVTPDALARHLGSRRAVHHAQPAAVSLTQATEAGTVYTPAEVKAIAAVAKEHGLALHMDGARFANALVALNVAPAEITWRAGVDALSLGATKNGALAAEAAIFFEPARAADVGFRRKRGGHLFSKMRFLSAQLEAYLTEDLWLRNARHANAMAARLSSGLTQVSGARLCYPTQANEVFVELPEPVLVGLAAAGFGFYRSGKGGGNCIRLVTAFDTRQADVDAFVAAARRLAG